MSLFDSLIGEVAGKFGLGDKSGWLMSALLKYITSENTGGIGGFLDKFKGAGLGDLASSWLGGGEKRELSVDQLTQALGERDLNAIANDAGLNPEVAKPALAALIPGAISHLTPDGGIPTSLPETVMSYLKGGAGAAIGAAGAAIGLGADAVGAGAEKVSDAVGAGADMLKGGADAAMGAVEAGAEKVSDAVGAGADMLKGGVSAGAGALRSGAGAAADFAGDVAEGGSSMLFKLLPLLALALLAFLGYKYCVTEPAHNNTAAVATPTPAAKPGAKAIDSSLNIAVRDGKYFLSGVIPDEKTKQEIIDKATAAYGAGNFDVSGLKIDANAKAPDWLGKLGDAFTALKGAANGAVLSFAGAGVKLEGLAGAAAQGLMDKLKGLFPTISLAVPVNEATAAEEAEKKAGDALSALPANFTVEQLAEAMNLQIINFPSGGATIPKDREDILTRSADFIKKLPADAKLEVGGHTDNRGAAATNSALSAKRADAVKAFLVGKGVNAAALTTKGYGPEKPIASNDTDSGRFQNRRIEFTAAK